MSEPLIWGVRTGDAGVKAELTVRLSDRTIVAASAAAEAFWGAASGSLSGYVLDAAMPAARALTGAGPDWPDAPFLLVFWTKRGSQAVSARLGKTAAEGEVRIELDLPGARASRVLAAGPVSHTSGSAQAADAATLAEIARMIRAGMGAEPVWSEAAPAAANAPAGTAAADPLLAYAGMLDVLDVPAILVSGAHRYVSRGLRNKLGGPELSTKVALSLCPGIEAVLAGASDRLRFVPLGGTAQTAPCTRHELPLADGSGTAVLIRLDEAALARAAAAEEEKRQVDYFAAVSHEVRTPLGSIIGFAEVMRDEALGPIAPEPIANEKYRGYVQDMLESARHALSLVNDLLDLSRIRAGALPLDPVQLDVPATVAAALATLKPQADQAGIALEIAAGDGLPDVIADRRSIKQMVLNLAGNAIKFSGPKGRVKVATRVRAGDVVVEVSDTGPGMTPAEVAVALEPFRQVGDRTAGGSGLGLPLTKALAEANGATMSIDSAPGRGTVMRITFPAARTVPV